MKALNAFGYVFFAVSVMLLIYFILFGQTSVAGSGTVNLGMIAEKLAMIITSSAMTIVGIVMIGFTEIIVTIREENKKSRTPILGDQAK